MKRIASWSCIAALVLTTSAFAQGAKKSAAIRVAYVDMQEAILLTDEGKAAREVMEKDLKKKRDEILEQEKELKKFQEEFQAQQAVLSDEAKTAKQRDFQKKYEAYQSARSGFEQEAREKEMQETQKIVKKMQPIVDELAKKNGYDLVFERASGGLLYAVNPTSITQEIVNVYNSKFKVKK